MKNEADHTYTTLFTTSLKRLNYLHVTYNTFILTPYNMLDLIILISINNNLYILYAIQCLSFPLQNINFCKGLYI